MIVRRWQQFRHISDGTPLAACVELLNDVPNLVAVGINCTPPRFVPELITAVQAHTNKFVIVYPNSGEQFDPATKTWLGQANPAEFGTISREWRKMGALLVGGCCRTGPEHMRQIRDRTRPTSKDLTGLRTIYKRNHLRRQSNLLLSHLENLSGLYRTLIG